MMPRGRFSVALASPWPGLQTGPGLLQELTEVPLQQPQLCSGSGSLVLHSRALCAAPPQTTSLDREVIVGRVTCDIWECPTSRTPTPKSFSLGGHSSVTALSASPAPPVGWGAHLYVPQHRLGSFPVDPPAAHTQGGRQTARVLLERRPQLRSLQCNFYCNTSQLGRA